jgi:hypothetical protein
VGPWAAIQSDHARRAVGPADLFALPSPVAPPGPVTPTSLVRPRRPARPVNQKMPPTPSSV